MSPRGRSELRADVRHVAVHSVQAQNQPRGDLRIRQPVRHEPQDLALAGGQRTGLSAGTAALDGG